MFDKAMKKSIEPYLEAGEEPLGVLIVQGKGMTKAMLAGGVVGSSIVGSRKDKNSAASEAGVQLASKMGLAVTSRRLLIFKAGGAMTLKAQELITAIPIADIDSIEVGKGMMSKPITITVRGEQHVVEAPKAAKTSDLTDAFSRAKAGASVTA
jgi:hypothetical protein